MAATGDDDDTVYVAVTKDVEESKPTLIWALYNLQFKKICVLHVHQPVKHIPLNGVNFPASRLEQHERGDFQELERKMMHKILDDYLLICREAQIYAEKLYIEMDDIGKGIVELIYHKHIKKLVMGAAADEHYSEGMIDLRSKKAKYIQQRVPHSCQVWYICQSHLILTREGESSCSSTESSGDSASDTEPTTESSGLQLGACDVQQSDEEFFTVMEGSSIDLLYSQLEQALVEVEKNKRETFEESLRRVEATKTCIKAVCKATALENLYTKELKRRKECEEALAKAKEGFDRMKQQLDEAQLMAKDKSLIHQIQIADLDNQINELQLEKENALLLANGFAKQVEDSQRHQSLRFFSLLEIKEATRNFDSSLKIGEGGYGSVYKGFLHHTEVAIKVLNGNSLQGQSEFTQEVQVLSKIRHPNIVSLIGACPENSALIYEYMPGGNLEDRLWCNHNTPPLQWQARIHIATELCSALIFLHNSSPDSIVHGDLKPGNILLDSNLRCKLSDFGICRALSRNMTLCHQTDPKGTFFYVDPHFLATRQLTPKSDVYAFGIILLQLLTTRPVNGIVQEIRAVINEGNLEIFLDQSGGRWPFVQAKQLARLALQCCEEDRSKRPDLSSEVWKVLEPMRYSSGASASSSPFRYRYQQN